VPPIRRPRSSERRSLRSRPKCARTRRSSQRVDRTAIL
jgi:hypothetical protein